MQNIQYFILNAPFPLLVLVMGVSVVLAYCLVIALIWLTFFCFFFLLELFGLSSVSTFLITPIDDLFSPRKRRKIKSKYHRQPDSYLAKATRASNNNPGYAGAWHQLLKRVNFDVALAERLVSQCQRNHPDKNDRWCIEKVIWDLERDQNRN